MSPLVLAERQDSLALVTLNRPERHNSLVPELLDALLNVLSDLEKQPAIRAVVLQANGPSFSTGGDLVGFRDHLDDLEAYADRIVGLLNETIMALLNLDMPVVAAVQGMVNGGSIGLVLASDVVFVSPKTSFTPYYGVVGFSPDGGWTALLPAVIGTRRTAEILLANRTITAQQAVEWGLASQFVASRDLRTEAVKTAGQIAAMQPGSVRRSKKLLSCWYGEPKAKLDLERENFLEEISRAETRRSMLAFLDNMSG